MFILIEHTFNDDANRYLHTAIAVSANESLLLAKAEENRLDLEARKAKNKKFYDEILPAWNAANPRPEVKSYEELEFPKWESVPGVQQVITSEMRAERNSIIEQNKKIADAAYADHNAWHERYTQMNIDNCVPPSDEDAYWKVETIEEIK